MGKRILWLIMSFLVVYSSCFGAITLDVKNVDIIDVLKILADEADFNISVSGEVKGRVTLFLKDIDARDALEIALLSANLTYENKGDIIYVMTAKEYEDKYGKKYWDNRKIKVYNLQFAKALRARELLSHVLSSSGKVIIDAPTNTMVVVDIPDKLSEVDSILGHIDRPIETRVFELDYLTADGLNEQLRSILTKDVGTLNIDTATNKVIVTDYPEKLAQVQELIEAFDEKPLQVLINAKIVELRPSKEFYAGINWDYWIEEYFRVKGSFAIPSPSGVTDKASFGTIGVADPAGKGDYTGVIDFLETFGEVRILSSPRILVLNNQEAKILVGTKDAYITSTVSEIGESAVTTQEVNFVDVGIKLFVTPTINKSGYITMKIKPEISSAERMELVSEDKVTEVPIVSTSEAETTVVVKEGVSIIIGGLKKVTERKETRRVPILGSIPFLGALFRSKSDAWNKDELVILLTPQIVSGDRSIEEEVKEKMLDTFDMGEGRTLSEFIVE